MKHELKYCPRCGAPFECKVGDVANCQCAEVRLHATTHTFLGQSYYGCLCKKCLAELDHLVQLAQSSGFPLQDEMCIEKLHYYVENGQRVYTEFYHILKGTCCKKGCKHCAYGFTNRIK